MQKQLLIFDTKENKILLKRWESPNCSKELMIEHAKKFIARSRKYNNNCIIISNFQVNI